MKATAKIGYYKCEILEDKANLAQHTYASLHSAGTESWYDCWGGHHGAGQDDEYPAYFYRKSGYFSSVKRTDKTEIPINSAWADAIAGWGSKDKQDIQNSHAGILYTITGVCHQTCNRILFAATEDDWGYINNPPSLNASWMLYGYYGGGRMGIKDKLAMGILYAFKEDRATLPTSPTPEYDTAPSVVAMLQDHLDFQPSQDQLMAAIASHYGVEKSDSRVAKVLEEQQKIYKQKDDFDRDLLSGNLRNKQEATQIVDMLGNELLSISMNTFETLPQGILSDGDDQHVLDGDSAAQGSSLAAEELMPDLGFYTALGSAVKY